MCNGIHLDSSSSLSSPEKNVEVQKIEIIDEILDEIVTNCVDKDNEKNEKNEQTDVVTKLAEKIEETLEISPTKDDETAQSIKVDADVMSDTEIKEVNSPEKEVVIDSDLSERYSFINNLKVTG